MQRTKLGNIISSSKPVGTVVPQGSTLGPQLYIVFSGELLEIMDQLTYTIYAGDTAMTVLDKDLDRAADRINSAMPMVSRWFNENKLTVKIKKTEYLVFGAKRKLAAAQPIKIEMGG